MAVSQEYTRFQEALSLPGHSLKSFYSEAPSDLIPTLRGPCPEFFNNNLVSPFRVIKQFKDSPHSNIRLFYFLLLRSTYEVETEEGFNASFMNAFVQIVFHKDFEIFFTAETEGERDLYNDQQFKKFFAEFVSILETDQPTNIQKALNNYPIMDTVFIHIQRSILASQSINSPFESKIPTAAVFGELSSLLGLNVTEHGDNCWKFEDSDMFCYQHNENELYLAYTVDTGNVTSEEASDNPQVLAGNFDSGTTQTISVSDVPIAPAVPVTTLQQFESPILTDQFKEQRFADAAPLVESNYTSSYISSQVNSSAYNAAVPFATYQTNFTKPLTGGSDYTGYVSKLDQYIKPSTTAAEFSYARSYEPPNYESFSYEPKKYDSVAPIPSITPLPVLSQTFGVPSVGGGAVASWSSDVSAVRSVGGSGDYINDFTNDQLVEKMEEPYKSKVIQIKQRVRDWKRPSMPIGVSYGTATAASSTSWERSYGGAGLLGGSFGAGPLTGGYTSSVETVSYSRALQI